jgi:hypothetical protein
MEEREEKKKNIKNESAPNLQTTPALPLKLTQPSKCLFLLDSKIPHSGKKKIILGPVTVYRHR